VNIATPTFTLGALIALIVLIICIVLAVAHTGPSNIVLGLIAALAVARLT
jgi:uncharacterized membrane protein